MTKPETKTYNKKPFTVEAVRITNGNFDQVRQWCNGKVGQDLGLGDKYFRVQVRRPLNERQTRAYVGDWILFAGKGFKVYSDKAFRESYEVADNVEEMYQKGLEAMKHHQEELPFNVVDHTDQVGKLRPRIPPKPAPVRPLTVVRTAKAVGNRIGFSGSPKLVRFPIGVNEDGSTKWDMTEE